MSICDDTHPFKAGDLVMWADEDPRPANMRGEHPRERYGNGPFVVDDVEVSREEDAAKHGLRFSPADRFKVKIGDRSFSSRWFKPAGGAR